MLPMLECPDVCGSQVVRCRPNFPGRFRAEFALEPVKLEEKIHQITTFASTSQPEQLLLFSRY